MSGSTQTGGAAINVANLLSTLAPLFLGSGNKTTTTSGGTSTVRDSGGTTTSTSKSSSDAGTISSLQGVANTAGANAVDTTKTDALVADILRQSAQAFTPVIAQQSSAGLYNSSTLALLSNEARARATSASSKAVLDYQTGQQQIQTNALSNLLGATKSTTTETTAPATTRTVDNPSTTAVTVQAPAVDPMTSLLTLGGGILGNSLLKSKTLGDLPGEAGSFLKSSVLNPVTDALGITQGATSLGAQSSLLAPTTTNAAGKTIFSSAVGAGEEGLAGVSVAADAFPTSTASLLSSGLGDTFTADSAALAALQGGTLATFGTDAAFGAASLADDFTASAGSLISDNFLDFSSAAPSAFSDVASIGGSILESAGVSALASAPSIAEALLGAGSAGPDANLALNVAEGAIGAGAAATAGAAAAGSELLPFLLALAAWIICTELKLQGKMSSSLYRYGLLHFDSYPEFGKYGYLLWAKPVRDKIRREPNSSFTATVATIFNLRVNNIAYRRGCKHARWTLRGALICGATYSISWLLGVALIPLRAAIPTVSSYFTPTMEG